MKIGRLNRALVVDEAARLADRDGVAALTMAALAKQLGVALPSLYAHVRSLQHLRQEISLAVNEALCRLMAEAIQGRSGRDALASLAAAYRAYAVAHAGRYAAAMLISPDLSDPRALKACESCAAILCDALRGYDLEGERLVHGMRFFRAALHGFVSLEGQGGFQGGVSPDASFDALLVVVDRTLTEWPRAAG